MPDTSWLDLLSWLERHGFDRSTLKVELHESPAGGGRKLVATSDILPQQKLISLPTSTLLNSVTISSLYDLDMVEELSAIQLLCLHLSLHRFTTSSFSETAEDFIPYIRTLPQDLSTVPLWREVTKDESWTCLFNQDGIIPSGLRSAVDDVSKRFWKDWKRTTNAWQLTNTSRTLNVEDYAWAWLCVNSRCIYYDLELPSREDNITLAPIIDMGNHNCGQPTKIVQLDNDFCLLSSGYDSHIGDWSEKTILIKKGEEVKYSYSAHSDYILSAEYGFAMGMPANSDNVLDVTERVIRLFEELEDEERQLKKSILEANDYWGEYHFILSEGRVDVSYRLTMALALFHMKRGSKANSEKGVPSPRKRNKTLDESQAGWDFQPFYDLVNGIREEISAENVRLSNETLQRLCRDVEDDSKAALARLADVKADETMLELLRTILKDELWFAVRYRTSSSHEV